MRAPMVVDVRVRLKTLKSDWCSTVVNSLSSFIEDTFLYISLLSHQPYHTVTFFLTSTKIVAGTWISIKDFIAFP